MYAFIMAGGSGTRFWPLSREKTPKQLLKIGGDDTLICETVSRILPFVRIDDVFIVTNRALAESIGRQLSSRFDRPWDENFILEPEAKNTAPALGLAALHLERSDPESIMVVLAADHSIRKTNVFGDLLRTAAEAARLDYLVTLGIKPDRPETGYGYIKAGECVKIAGSREQGAKSLYKVAAFVEKPNIETAKEYRKSGGTEKEAEVVKEVFRKLESISIDYAIIEKTDRAAVIPADIGWSDVGSWTALDDVSDRDAAGNIITGNVIDIGSRDSIIYAEKRLVATIGLKDAVVVDTPDATLVCSKERAQDVKKVVDELKKRKAEEHLNHRTVHRPWGSYTVLENGDRYKIKRLAINPGAKLSHQLHHHRSEHWVVVAGTARVTNGDREYDVHPNESTYIPMSTKHRLENRGRVPLQIIEVQNGEYLEEDDIVRFDDDYLRHQNDTMKFLPSLTHGNTGKIQ